jgi:anti-sigma-K factor RskA
MSLEEQLLQKLMNTLSSPEAKQVTLTETKRPSQPVGHAIYMERSGALIFMASNLRPMPQNKTYELWLIPANGKAPIPAGLFRPDASGDASVVMPTIPAGVKAKAFGVTVEDAQGSATPTLPIVMSGS